MESENPKAVTKPIAMVLIRARGTNFVASATSSARWTAPSIPANMKFGLAIPVKKTTAFDFHPVWLMNVVQTNSDELKVGVRERQVTMITTNDVTERMTRARHQSGTLPHSCGVRTYIQHHEAMGFGAGGRYCEAG